MIIKTITCHDVRNHGASLQAFALQTFLEGWGHNVEVIDYIPSYFAFSIKRIGNPKFNKPLIRQLRILIGIPSKLKRLKRQRIFDRFNRTFLHRTARYSSFQDLLSAPPIADVYIAGSDQIWNTQFQSGRDPAFYLDFVPIGKKRVSYAASFASNNILPRYEGFVKDMLSKFDAISVREFSSLGLLKDLGREDGVSVLDPVFLLTSEQWSKYLGFSKEKNYILVYDFDNNPEIKRLAINLSSKYKMSIVGVGPNRIKYSEKSYVFIGPLDFLRLCKDASMIISNSFHATAFSLIFHVPFYVVNRFESINIRMHDLLEQVGLLKLIIADNNGAVESIPNIDWDDVQNKIDSLIKDSKDFLKQSIEL